MLKQTTTRMVIPRVTCQARADDRSFTIAPFCIVKILTIASARGYHAIQKRNAKCGCDISSQLAEIAQNRKMRQLFQEDSACRIHLRSLREKAVSMLTPFYAAE